VSDVQPRCQPVAELGDPEHRVKDLLVM